MNDLSAYKNFELKTQHAKRTLLKFLISTKDRGETVVGYGAPAKASTLLNYCGIRSDLIEFTVDRSPHKRGKFVPGSRIPIKAVNEIFHTKPNYVFIFPWNLKREIMDQMSGVREWGGKFVVSTPTLEVIG